jgi:hypothetical protein
MGIRRVFFYPFSWPRGKEEENVRTIICLLTKSTECLPEFLLQLLVKDGGIILSKLLFNTVVQALFLPQVAGVLFEPRTARKKKQMMVL